MPKYHEINIHFKECLLAARQGLEPRLPGPKPDVLPLHHRAIMEVYKREEIIVKASTNKIVKLLDIRLLLTVGLTSL